MKNQKGALILSHLQQEGSCTLGGLLIERGMRVRTINSPRTWKEKGLTHIDPLRPDLLIIMGGPIGVYQADDYPFLHDEMAMLKTRIDAGLPTIGICLGSQLMAQAMGATVRKGEAGKEVGWKGLTLTEAGKSSPAAHLCESKTSMFHWHSDTYDLPQGATLLASTDQYENQIYTFGKAALGLQCHPEVCRRPLEEWFVMFNGDITGDAPLIPVDELRKQTDAKIETLNKQATLFFGEWLDEVGL